MSRTFGRHACGRSCIVCAYTPARNLRDEAAHATLDLAAEVDECLNNIVFCRDGSSRLDYAYDLQVDDDLPDISDRTPLTVPLWQMARVA